MNGGKARGICSPSATTARLRLRCLAYRYAWIIADDKATTARERVVAQRLSSVKHEVRAEDKPKLEALIHDQAAPESLKTLASVMLTLHHTPSAADREKLKSLVP
jgi:hypothetical protein